MFPSFCLPHLDSVEDVLAFDSPVATATPVWPSPPPHLDFYAEDIIGLQLINHRSHARAPPPRATFTFSVGKPLGEGGEDGERDKKSEG